MQLKIIVNGHYHNYISPETLYEVFDRDIIEFRISNNHHKNLDNKDIVFYLEDKKLEWQLNQGIHEFTEVKSIFIDSFGDTNLKIFIENSLAFDINFNVMTGIEKFNHIKYMLDFLYQCQRNILEFLFIKNPYSFSYQGEGLADINKVLSLAGEFIMSIYERLTCLDGLLRHKIESIKEPLNEHNIYNIDPYDIIDNMSKLRQGYSFDSVNIFGKTYSLEEIPRENYRYSYDVEENRAILSGLIAIKNVLNELINRFEKSSINFLSYKNKKQISHFINYAYSFDKLINQNIKESQQRILNYLSLIDEIIRYFIYTLKVSDTGFTAPNVSIYVKKSSFYLKLFELLHEWYSLGNPNTGIDENLSKIRSASKIYEWFVLYKLIETFQKNGWLIQEVINDNDTYKNAVQYNMDLLDSDKTVPMISQVIFKKDDKIVNLFYQKKVYYFTNQTDNQELVSLEHDVSSHYNYYHPDFILEKQQADKKYYYILDAKYSHSKTLEEYKTIDELFGKYYINLAVYNKESKTLTKENIKAIYAIHPFGNQIFKWRKELRQMIRPITSSLLVSDKQNDLSQLVDILT